MAKITVLGLGAMGSRMAFNLIADGHEVTLWNRSAGAADTLLDDSAAVRVAEFPAQAVAEAEFAIAMLRDDEASESVWINQGTLAALPASAVAIECSTITPDWARRLSIAAAAEQRALIAAPLAGSRPQAQDRKLIFFMGGEPPVCEAAAPLLDSIGGATQYVGSAADAAWIKLAVNGLLGIQVAAMAELIALLEAVGMESKNAVDVITATPVCSPAAKMAASSMLSGDYAPQFPIDLIAKDFGYLTEAARQANAHTPVADTAAEVFTRAAKAGLGADNMTAVIQRYR